MEIKEIPRSLKSAGIVEIRTDQNINARLSSCRSSHTIKLSKKFKGIQPKPLSANSVFHLLDSGHGVEIDCISKITKKNFPFSREIDCRGSTDRIFL